MNTTSFYLSDSWLDPFREVIDRRIAKCFLKEKQLVGNGNLGNFAMGHYYYGLHRLKDSWVFREWAPNAKSIFVIGVFTNWKEKKEFMMNRINTMGDWEIILSPETIKHGDLYKLSSLGRRQQENAFLRMRTELYRMRRQKYSMPRFGNLK
jgi:1,4-alpha-glucan branching enzyme